ncbi:PREDICTED: uncharacterized protein LOC106820888 [Priapulus caudatus]|uniref:Uncharacterized protein LOC106820888 n=1 Tax=Priapulus caudatus TaxID=37621 RepID=A0ABM1F945_PRICU|nr:PREDICTED: uncharacterized protein LOC106820888 [Priapulus caudatus]
MDKAPTSALMPVLRKIFHELEAIKSEQRLLRKAVSKLRLGRGQLREDQNDDGVEVVPEGTFPIQSKEGLLIFERKLKETTFKDQVVKYLSVFGNNDMGLETRRILGEVLGNEVAAGYNLSGTGMKGKGCFRDLTLYRAIFEVILIHHKEAKEDDYRCYVKKWFNGVGDRQGGRKKRGEEKRRRVQLVQEGERNDEPERDVNESSMEESG